MSIAALVAFSGVFVLGVIFAFLGSIKLKLAKMLMIDDAKAGALFSAVMLSCLVASLIVGPLTDILGYRLIAIIGFGLSGVSVWLLSLARSYRAALISCLVLGVAAMCVNTVGNVLGPTILFSGQYPARASNLLNIFFGMGTLLTPLVLALLLGRLGFGISLGFIGVILFVPIALPAFATFPPPGEGFDVYASLALLGNPAVLLGGFGLFCSIAIQSSLAGFVTTYLKTYRFSDEKAGLLLSAFWLALILARVVVAAVPTDMDPAIMTPVLAAVMAAAIGGMIMAQSRGVSVACTLLAGLALGPIFPTIVGVSLIKTNAIPLGTAGSVFGLIFAMGLCGGIVVPTLVGKYAVRMGILHGFKIVLAVSLALVLISGALFFAPAVEAEMPEEALDEEALPAPVIPGVIGDEAQVEDVMESSARPALKDGRVYVDGEHVFLKIARTLRDFGQEKFCDELIEDLDTLREKGYNTVGLTAYWHHFDRTGDGSIDVSPAPLLRLIDAIRERGMFVGFAVETYGVGGGLLPAGFWEEHPDAVAVNSEGREVSDTEYGFGSTVPTLFSQEYLAASRAFMRNIISELDASKILYLETTVEPQYIGNQEIDFSRHARLAYESWLRDKDMEGPDWPESFPVPEAFTKDPVWNRFRAEALADWVNGDAEVMREAADADVLIAVDYLETGGPEMYRRLGDSKTFLRSLVCADVIQVNWHWHLGVRAPNDIAYENVYAVMEETGREWAIAEHMTLNGSDFKPEEVPDLLRNALRQGTRFSWDFVNVAPNTDDPFAMYHNDWSPKPVMAVVDDNWEEWLSEIYER